MYFSASIFALVGFRSPILTSLSIAITNFLFTLVAFAFIDRVGRRRILLWSVPVMVAGLVLCAVAFRFIELPPQEKASSLVASSTEGSKAWPLVILVAMVTYVAGYAVGMGNVPWQQSEYVMFPLSPQYNHLRLPLYRTFDPLFSHHAILTFLAPQTLPPLCSLPRLRARHRNKLGLQHFNRHHFSPHDGPLHSGLDIRVICICMSGRLDCGVEDLS